MLWVLILVRLLPQQETASDSFDRLRQVYFALFGLQVPVRNEGFAAQALAAVGRKVRAVLFYLQLACCKHAVLIHTPHRMRPSS